MKPYITHILSALALLTASALQAQNLHKDITVEQAINPVQRDAARIAVLPAVMLPAVKPARLDYSSHAVSTQVPPSITLLDPVAWREDWLASPARGYLDLGLGTPSLCCDLSAGYRLVDTSRTRLALWGQYNGDVYHRRHVTWHDQSATAAIDLHQAVGASSWLGASVDFTRAYHDMPSLGPGAARVGRTASGMHGSLSFSSRLQGLDYSASLRYGRFGYGSPHHARPVAGVPQLSQSRLGASVAGRLASGEKGYAALDIDADMLHSARSLWPSVPYLGNGAVSVPTVTDGIVGINPRYEYQDALVTLRAGARVDLAVNCGKALHIAPDVLLAWRGLQVLGLEVRAGGGAEVNALEDLYALNPYTAGLSVYRPGYLRQAYDARLTAGPFLGVSLQVMGGYADASHWLMPVVGNVAYAPGMWEPVDLKGWHYGARLAYDNGASLAIEAGYEGAPSSFSRGYCQWRDRARHVADIKVKLRPTAALTVEAGYELRAGRAVYAYSDEPSHLAGLDWYPPRRVPLGTVGCLSAGASYAIGKAITVWVHGDNLLSRDALLPGLRPIQGATAMAGASLKF